MSIYPHVPYFYIIQHSISGLLYAGSRRSTIKTKFSNNGCNPIEFMVLGGYCTSSNIVKKIIKDDGLLSFNVIIIIPESECNNLTVLDYETKFLQDNNIANNEQWINKHNNNHDFNFIANNFYGVDNIMKVPEYAKKSAQNCKKTVIEKYGVEYILQLPYFKEKQQKSCNQTVVEKYGVSNVFELEEIKIKSKEKLLEKYGVDHFNKTEINKTKRSNKNNELKMCDHCKLEIKNSLYFGFHGKFCHLNPNKEIKKNGFVYQNIHTLEKIKFDISQKNLGDSWITPTGVIYKIYNKDDVLIKTTGNLTSACIEIGLPLTLFYKTILKNEKLNLLKSGIHKKTIEKYKQFNGWYCVRTKIKDICFL